jgi:hypothetical protein
MTARMSARGGPSSPGREDSGRDSRRIDGDSGEGVRPLFPRHDRSRVGTRNRETETRDKWTGHLYFSFGVPR